VINLNEDSDASTTLTKEDRKKALKLQGLPPSPAGFIGQLGNGKIDTTVLVGTETVDGVDFSDLTRRTYWTDNGRGPKKPEEYTSESP